MRNPDDILRKPLQSEHPRDVRGAPMKGILVVLLVVLLVLSLAGNLYLGFLLLDAGITLTYAESTSEQLWERRQLALEIMRRDWLGRSASEVDDFARELEKEGIMIGTDGEIREIGDFLFYVEDGVVVDVQDLGSGVESGR